ncbi:sulfatase-like hydrolase/transferase [Nonomuraea sp. NBC_00507]|uniref:sulfatase family protein n=1 Tax=Nonomuraea sp. NBC_00507 TaxID=2976002 RepID=UPI002E16F857
MTAAEGAARRPNVLVIQADQFRADCLGAAGNTDVHTPNLDGLAADGVRYSNAFCPFPVCTPSRYSLLSGLHVRRHGGWTNRSTLAPGIDTFPKALRRAGYRTAAVGKMHLTPTYLDVGYDTMELAEQDGPGRYEDDYHRELAQAGLTPVTDLVDQEQEFRAGAPVSYWQTYGAGRTNLPEEWHSTTWIAERALGVLDSWSDGGGQLLHVSFVKPHHPFDPPAPWDELYDPDRLTPLPGWTDAIPDADLPYRRRYFDYEPLTLPVLRRVMSHYYATITQLDHHVGRLLDHLRERGLYDDTLIVFTSDHGEYLGFHHLLLKDGPMYDPLVKVPLLVKFPGTGGRRNRADGSLVSLVDLAPTILSACGATSRTPLSGVDLAASASGRDVVFAEDNRDGLACMVRTAQHKLIRWADREAMFDLTRDPYELDDRIADPGYGDVVTVLRDALCRWALLDALPHTYADPAAPQIRGARSGPSSEPRAFFTAELDRRVESPIEE